MKCQTCGSENPSGARFCGECGTPAKTPASSSVGTQPSVVPTTSERKQPSLDEHYCSSCGEVIKKAAELCPKCGVRLMDAPVNSYTGRDSTRSGTLRAPGTDGMVSFPQAVKLGYTRYTDFSGRSTRAEYWWFFLFQWVAGLLLLGFDATVGTYSYSEETGAIGLFSTLFGVVSFIPHLAVMVRRLHDINRYGWWILWLGIGSILIIPLIIWLVWDCTPSDAGDNKYGPKPSQPMWR